MTDSPAQPLKPFRPKVWVNQLHRYLGLIVFGQVMIWSLGGMLMAGLDFSDLYLDPKPAPLLLDQANLSPQALQKQLEIYVPKSQLLGVEIKNLAGQLAYELKHTQGTALLLNAQGQKLEITPELASHIATAGYTGQGKMVEIQKLSNSTGNYYSSTPVYIARFDDAQKTEIYIDPQTGGLLARRKAIWGLYNRMWEWHLMKFTPYPKLNKALLLGFALLNVIVALTGFVKFFRWGYRMQAAPLNNA